MITAKINLIMKFTFPNFVDSLDSQTNLVEMNCLFEHYSYKKNTWILYKY